MCALTSTTRRAPKLLVVSSIHCKLVFICHKLMFSLRFESTLKISLPSSAKPSSKNLFLNIDGPEKTNYHPQWRPIKRQDQQHCRGHGLLACHWLTSRHRGHWLLLTSRSSHRRPTDDVWSGEDRAQKVYVLKWRFKVCVLWLPRYYRYSIEAKTSRIHKDGRR